MIEGIVKAATMPMIAKVIKTSARVNPPPQSRFCDDVLFFHVLISPFPVLLSTLLF